MWYNKKHRNKLMSRYFFTKKIFISLLFLAGFFWCSGVAYASYDAYVDASNKGDASADGTSEHPFENIEDAIKDDKSKIYIKNGEYKEKITLKSGMELYGESKSAVITGGVIMSNKTSINNLTVVGTTTGVAIQKDASVSIVGCDVKNSKGNGVDIAEGSGKLVIKNSKLYANVKGVYVQRGNDLEITGSDIYGNGGEGLDLRAKIKGTIKNNSIYNNKEGGIEIVVGSSDISISNNTIKSNSSSGIAAQFYSENKKTGQVKITSNKITKNGHYGISCGTPSGGNPAKGYWSKSLELKNNNIDNNKGKAIAGACKLIEAVEEEEEKDNVIAEDPNAKEIAETEAEKEKLKKEEEEKMKEDARLKEEMEKNAKEAEVQQKVVLAHNESAVLLKKISAESECLKKTGRIKKFFFGTNKEDIARINSELVNLDDSIEKLRTISGEVEQEEIRVDIATKIEELERQKEEIKKNVEKSSKKKGVFGWIAGLFGSE